MVHGPRITVPLFHPVSELTLDELRREAGEMSMLAHNALGMHDGEGGAKVIGRGFRLSRELRLRLARLHEQGEA